MPPASTKFNNATEPYLIVCIEIILLYQLEHYFWCTTNRAFLGSFSFHRIAAILADIKGLQFHGLALLEPVEGVLI
jgi:hypothetical protein